TLGPTISTTVVNTRGTSSTTIGRTLGPTISTTIMNTRGTSSSAVSRSFVFVEIVVRLSHGSS
ncbi:hypothetical protein, partial [Rothia koreensis]|uniref:hypothetical protein n=1 Tax=Rothia koreensis TaxID=592378 RepID=UPI00197DFF8E